MRGKPRSESFPPLCSRITPARAGKTYVRPSSVTAASDHPARAGKTDGYETLFYRKEDHPRACGENQLHVRPNPADTDHPRACGENSRNVSISASSSGSPPRVRGKPVLRADCLVEERITPARAGKTLIGYGQCCTRQDHPRACGENTSAWIHGNSSDGSPPRVRGKPAVELRELAAVRITPARAGKTRRLPVASRRNWDHPRACGENAMQQDEQTRYVGSPPRVRGKPPARRQERRQRGITPARAGKTHIDEQLRLEALDHPRACGENQRLVHPCEEHDGSPPRVRGKPREHWQQPQHQRITPARAGKTQ